jgi:hypothetical protein
LRGSVALPAFCRSLRRHSPRKRGIQYAASSPYTGIAGSSGRPVFLVVSPVPRPELLPPCVCAKADRPDCRIFLDFRASWRTHYRQASSTAPACITPEPQGPGPSLPRLSFQLKSGRNVCPTLVAAAQTKRGSMSDIRRLLNDPSCLAITSPDE